MKEIILPPLRSHVPGVSAVNPKPTWHLPIHVYQNEGIDLDFGPLLLFDRAIVDASSLEYIKSSNRKDLAPLARSLEELKDAGYIDARDLGGQLTSVRSTIEQHVDRLVKDPLPLRAPLLRGIEGYRTTIPSLKQSGVSYDNDALSVGFGMHLMMMQKYGHIKAEEKRRLDRLLLSGKRYWRSDELSDVRALIRPTVTYLYQNMVLGELLGAPFLDVDYTSEFYAILRKESMLAFNADANMKLKQIQEGQNLFSCIIPELRPSSAKTMIAFLNSTAVKDFRDYISCVAKEGRSITDRDYRLLLTSTLNAERKFREVKDRIAWGERLLSLIPGYGLAVSGISMLIENVVYRSTVKKSEWVYALIKAASNTKRKVPLSQPNEQAEHGNE